MNVSVITWMVSPGLPFIPSLISGFLYMVFPRGQQHGCNCLSLTPFSALCVFFDWSCKICENSSDLTDLSHMPTSEPLWCGEIMCTNWLWFGHWLFLWPSLHFLLLCFGLLSLSSVTEPLHMLSTLRKTNLPALPDDDPSFFGSQFKLDS